MNIETGESGGIRMPGDEIPEAQIDDQEQRELIEGLSERGKILISEVDNLQGEHARDANRSTCVKDVTLVDSSGASVEEGEVDKIGRILGLRKPAFESKGDFSDIELRQGSGTYKSYYQETLKSKDGQVLSVRVGFPFETRWSHYHGM